MSRLCTSLSIEINVRDLRQRRALAGAGLASSRKAPRGWSKRIEATQKRCLSGASAGAKDDTSVRKGKTGRRVQVKVRSFLNEEEEKQLEKMMQTAENADKVNSEGESFGNLWRISFISLCVFITIAITSLATPVIQSP